MQCTDGRRDQVERNGLRVIPLIQRGQIKCRKLPSQHADEQQGN